MAKRGCFNDIRFFVLCYGLLILADIMASVMKRSSLTTLERRFNLPSTSIALLSSSSEIGSLTLILFASYLGSRWHRPRTIFLGSLFIAGGNLVTTLPQFLGGRYEYEDISTNRTSLSSSGITECSGTDGSGLGSGIAVDNAKCEVDVESSAGSLYVLLILGAMLSGAGASVLQPLGLSYIDDFAHPRNSPIYLGFAKAIALLGPMVGYIVSSRVLKLWVDIGWVKQSSITIVPTHPSWVGAWWLGIVICTVGILVTMMPMPYFPKKMEKQTYKGEKESKMQQYEEKKELDEKNKTGHNKNDSKVSRETKRLTDTLKSIARNHLFHLVLLKMYFAGAALVGIINFFPKYLEVAFGVSAAKANLLTGIINIPCLVFGILLGAFLMKRLNLSSLGTVKLVLIGTGLATASMAAMIFIGCETISTAGITTPYYKGYEENLPDVNSPCNYDCSCATGVYTPVCGSDGVSYVSPCYAGCTGINQDDTGMIEIFTNCSCIAGSITWAKPERCELSNCAELVSVALTFKSLASFFAGMTATPIYVLLIRTVPPDQKAFAIGINILVSRTLAWIPGPLVYGSLIDSSCLYWGIKPCSDKAYCKVYDNTGYRRKFYGLVVLFNILSCMTAIALYIAVKRRQSTQNNESTGNETKKAENIELIDRIDGNTENKDELETEEETRPSTSLA